MLFTFINILKTCKNKYLVAVGYKHGTIVIINAQSEQMKILFKLKSHEDAINYLYWNPKDEEKNLFKLNDQSLILCSSSDDKTIRFWSIEDGTLLKVIPAPISGSLNRQQKSVRINLTPLCWPTSSHVLSASFKYMSFQGSLLHTKITLIYLLL